MLKYYFGWKYLKKLVKTGVGGENPIGGSVRGLILLNTENIEKKIEIDEAITEHR